ncbi:XRE family transcriptional regulator [uncultured Lamprocystis sp.]|jgi:hypothetical protein|uniref:XRE family transcriptional regulator n=1 Tax=uncultured Lamprocystis sp. TaxID=543132 RepID=UPI0025D080DD|nr:XRE family transcriptional regulator [uncultured Lamprocystis sp.]
MSDPSNLWLERLRWECEQTSQARVVRQLRAASGCRFPSGTLISQVLNGCYPGRTARLQLLVDGLYGGVTVWCPVLGDITTDRCDANQHAPFSTVNPLRVMLYRACRNGCPNSRLDSD